MAFRLIIIEFSSPFFVCFLFPVLPHFFKFYDVGMGSLKSYLTFKDNLFCMWSSLLCYSLLQFHVFFM